MANNTIRPSASFTMSTNGGRAPLNVTFTDTSQLSPTSWEWSISPSNGVFFVNGTTPRSQNPQIAFSVSGTFVVTLVAINSAGSTTVTHAVTTTAPISLFGVAEHTQDKLLHTGYAYQGKVLTNSLSNFIFQDPTRAAIMQRFETVIDQLIYTVKEIKKAFEYGVSQDNDVIN